MKQISNSIYQFNDTCNVYLIKKENKGILIDFGSGSILNKVKEAGVTSIEAVLVTHHHRDQIQGLLDAENIPVYVPATEKELIADADAYWQSREIYNNYNNRQDRFSIRQSVPVAGILKDYSEIEIAGFLCKIIPTPGHTTGSISIEMEADGKKWLFSGDLIYGTGKVWSLAATQWTYNGGEGIPFSILSLLDIKERGYDFLLPSHGEIMKPEEAIDLTVERLIRLKDVRRHNPRLIELRETPFCEITPHLLFNRTSMANSYVLYSKSGKALFLDFGYDFMAGTAAGVDRSARRPWLYNIPRLMEQFGIKEIAGVIPTHYHDDHVAGFNLLREVYGAKIYCPDFFADIMEKPWEYDIPCLWYDSIPVDERLDVEKTFCWEEYEIKLHRISGHTRYSVVMEFVVDGKKVLCGGDQYADEKIKLANYVYKNVFHHGDFIETAKLYRSIHPDLIISGHWNWFEPTEEFYDFLEQQGNEIAQLHEELLPMEVYETGSTDFCATIHPYQSTVKAGETIALKAIIKNPLKKKAYVTWKVVTPKGFEVVSVLDDEKQMTAGKEIPAQQEIQIRILLRVSEECVRRERVALDIQAEEYMLGEQAECLITVK